MFVGAHNARGSRKAERVLREGFRLGKVRMIEVKEGIIASKATIARYPIYLRYLREKQEAGEENISSTRIADDLKLNPVQVRKDLALVSSVSGKPKLGFGVVELITDLERFLGLDNVNDAVLVGVGGLGKALLLYGGFAGYGLNIVAGFDVREEVIGTRVGNVPIFGTDKLKSTVERLGVKLGIVTVPQAAAQATADLLVASGIRGIWNFAPTHLDLPQGVTVKNEDLAASLSVLRKQLENVLEN